MWRIAALGMGCVFLLSFPSMPSVAESPKEASEWTRAYNASVLKILPFEDRNDFVDAQRGKIADIEGGKIGESWDNARFSFLDSEPAPDTVNPSLWRMGQLNREAGLFEVVEGIYQFRGYDLANMTIVEGENGLIVIDPLISSEAARAGLDLYRKTREGQGKRREVAAIIYTHPHIDHYGGVRGVLSGDPAKDEEIRIIAPEGFLEHAVSENLYTGTIMSRRSGYMYGGRLEPGPRGNVGSGLGMTTPRVPTSLVPPNELIAASGTRVSIEGVRMEFVMADETEAPVEMMIHFPDFKAFCGAEVVTHTLHNLYTLRGAQVRSAAQWWRAADSILSGYGSDIDYLFAQHHWHLQGNERIRAYLEKQRDAYKYLHDQTLRLANMGYTPVQIADMVHLPDTLAQEWHLRGYYGTVNHNVKAIYQLYLGWYDGNPANLHPLPPEQAARHYVDFMGGIDSLLEKARVSYDKGEYRWVAEVVKHAVFAAPERQDARDLLADALEQMGYQAESGPWRNNFLSGADELRNGKPVFGTSLIINPQTLAAMPVDMLLDYLAIALNPEKTKGKTVAFVWKERASGDEWGVRLQNDVLMYRKSDAASGALVMDPEVVLSSDKAALMDLLSGAVSFAALKESGRLSLVETTAGKGAEIGDMAGFFDTFSMNFDLVLPQSVN